MVTAMPRPAPVERLRRPLLALAPSEGHTTIRGPNLCLYRFHEPTTVVKAATFGVTLGLVVQGTKRVRVGDQEFTVDPERLLVLTREVDHASAVMVASPERPYLGLALCFSPEQVARALTAVAEAGGPTGRDEAPAAFGMPVDADLVDAVARLLRTFDDPLDRKLLAPLVVEEILYRLLRSEAAAAIRRAVGRNGDSTRILESMQFIRANLARKLSVAGLARQVAMSPSHFAHRFRAVARTSPMRYLREVRLDRARSLLFEDGARAGDVGVRVGFDSPAHFTREFKRRFGAPPSRYARSLAP